MVASTEKICNYVARVCADPLLADGGAQVLVLLDTYARPVFLRPPAPKPMRISTFPAKHAVAMMRTRSACMKTESGIAAAAAVPAEKARPVGVIGDRRPKQVEIGSRPVEVEERWKGWLPW